MQKVTTFVTPIWSTTAINKEKHVKKIKPFRNIKLVAITGTIISLPDLYLSL